MWTTISRTNTKGKSSSKFDFCHLILLCICFKCFRRIILDNGIVGLASTASFLLVKGILNYFFYAFLSWHGYVSLKHQKEVASLIQKLTWEVDMSIFATSQHRSQNKMMTFYQNHQNYVDVDIVWRGSWWLTLKEISYCSPPQISKPGS